MGSVVLTTDWLDCDDFFEDYNMWQLVASIGCYKICLLYFGCEVEEVKLYSVSNYGFDTYPKMSPTIFSTLP